jgi:hypothetical protein
LGSTDNGLQNISDVVAPSDLNTWAGIAGVMRYLAAPLDPPPAPTVAWPLAVSTMANAYSNTYAGLRQAGVDHVASVTHSGMWSAFLGELGSFAAWLVQLLALVLTPGAQVILTGLDAMRKGIDPSVATLAVSVLNEFLGTDFTQQNLPLGLGTGDHLARAQAIGQLLMTQLTAEFAPPAGTAVGPSTVPAATFTGLAVNFGIASAIMGIIGGLVPWGHVDELRELGEEVAQNIGLGRLVRRALQPLVQILVSKPMEWWVNTSYTPTQFSLSELVNQYAMTQLPQDQLFKAMNLLGYSADKIQAFIQMHQKRLTVSDVYMLVQNGGWTADQAAAYVATLGYPQDLNAAVFGLEDLREQMKWYDKLVAEMETEVKAGTLQLTEFSQVLATLPYSKAVQNIITATVEYKVKAHVGKPLRQLSIGQLTTAFEQGLVTESDLRQRWSTERYSDEDQDILMFLLLFAQQKAQAAAAAKAAKAANSAAKATTTPVLPTTTAPATTTPSGQPTTPPGTTTP